MSRVGLAGSALRGFAVAMVVAAGWGATPVALGTTPGAWTIVNRSPVGGGVAATAVRGLDGAAYLFGSGTDVYRLAPATNAITAAPVLSHVHEDAIVVSAGDGIYLIGGYVYPPGAVGGDVAVYDPLTGAQRPVPALPVALDDSEAAAAVGGDGRIYVVDTVLTHRMYAYLPGSQAWTTLPGPPVQTQSPAVTASGGRIYVIGGYRIDGSVDELAATSRLVQVYDPATGAWGTSTPLPAGLDGPVVTAAVGGGAKIWAITQGDSYGRGGFSYTFDPKAKTWSRALPLAGARAPTLPGFYDNPGYLSMNAVAAGAGKLYVGFNGRIEQAPVTASADTTAPTIGRVLPAIWGGSELPAFQDISDGILGDYTRPISSDSSGICRVEYIPNPAPQVDQYVFHTDSTYAYVVRAYDCVGNRATRQTPTFTVVDAGSAGPGFSYAGAWTSPSGFDPRSTTAAGASATFTFTGRNVAWVADKDSTRGKARVYVNGVLAATVDTGSDYAQVETVMFTKRWVNSGRHTLRIVNQATPGRPRIDVDGIWVFT